MIASDIVIAGRVRSNQIGKAFFGAPEAMDPNPDSPDDTVFCGAMVLIIV
jgi:hypothetical protein